jgi:hypothetical protein
LGINIPFLGGLNLGWKKAADLGLGGWFSCLSSGLATAAACTVGEVVTVGADTLVCAGGAAGTAAACSNALGLEEEEYMEYLISIGVSTPWGIGGNISFKKA